MLGLSEKWVTGLKKGMLRRLCGEEVLHGSMKFSKVACPLPGATHQVQSQQGLDLQSIQASLATVGALKLHATKAFRNSHKEVKLKNEVRMLA